MEYITAEREKFSSRLGFILISAGCSIGLGNIWRFPFITGKNGGAIFVLIYLFFLITIGLPTVVIESSIGRASRQNIGLAMKTLEPPKTKWHLYGPVPIIADYVVLMFYAVITGWVLHYMFSAKAIFSMEATAIFNQITSNPLLQVFWVTVVLDIATIVCYLGLKNGVEKFTKIMMIFMFIIMIGLAIYACTLDGAGHGLKFFLVPNWESVKQVGLGNVIFDALSQAFYTLSIGMGVMAVFGSYAEKNSSLVRESIIIIVLDTVVALLSGVIIFCACFSYGTQPNSGPSLLFITLPSVFTNMGNGKLICILFFLFMSIASISTIITTLESIVNYWMDVHHWSRRKSCIINFVLLIILTLPCILGFNVLSGVQPLGAGSTILDFEDFLVSTILFPIGGIVIVFFATSKHGWGWQNFLEEANTGKGLKIPKSTKKYFIYVLPLILITIFVGGFVKTIIGLIS